MKDFAVEVRIRNNQLLQRRRELGMTQGQLAAACGIPLERYNALETMRASPLRSKFAGGPKTRWRDIALALAAFHEVEIETLFPAAAREPGVPRRLYQVNASELPRLIESAHAEQPLLPSAAVEQVELHRLIEDALSSLSPREQKIVRLRMGLGGVEPQTLEAIARSEGVERDTIRKIEMKALSKLRHPKLSGKLRVFVEPDK